MKQFDQLDELNQTFVSINHKVKLTEIEKNEVFGEIKKRMNDMPPKPTKNTVQWKYLLASVAVTLLLVVTVIPILTNSGKDLLGINDQNPSNSSSDSNLVVSDAKEEYLVVKIINNTDVDIPQLELNVYQNGELKATQGSMNADGSPVEIGDYFEFTFTKEELTGVTSLEAVIIDPIPNKGRALFSSEMITLTVTEDKEYVFEINGSPKSNVYLQSVEPDISIESNKKKETINTTIHKKENEIAAMVQENVTLGLRKEQVESLLGKIYHEGISNMDGREYWRYDFGNKDYQYPNDDDEIGDTKALMNGELQAQVLLYWDKEENLNAFSVLFQNQKDGKVYIYYVLSDKSSGKSEIQVE
jgi:hypothetical protein